MAALAAAQGSLPTELVEVRPGRTLAVHARVLHDSTHTLVFVHGSAASMLQWGAQIERFSADHSVVAIDAYGCGRSPKPQDWAAYSFEALTADLIAVLKRLVPPGSTPVLVAHSAGCSMAIAAVAAGLYAGAGRVAGLCLLGGYVEAPVPHPVFYLPVPVLRLIQPILSSGFEVRRVPGRPKIRLGKG
jgi:abhydrolase domain-containing protein 8